jgi:hypothetical protein
LHVTLSLCSCGSLQLCLQVELAAAGGLVLSTKDKKVAVRLRCGSTGASSAASSAAQQLGTEVPMLAEPQAFYRLPDGSWWLEHCRFYTAAQATAAAAAQGASLALAPGFDHDCELLRAVERRHAPLSDVLGEQSGPNNLICRRDEPGGHVCFNP